MSALLAGLLHDAGQPGRVGLQNVRAAPQQRGQVREGEAAGGLRPGAATNQRSVTSSPPITGQ